MKHDFCETEGGIRIRPLDIKDIDQLRRWRNSLAEGAHSLSDRTYITEEQQEKWFRDKIRTSDEMIWAIDWNNPEKILIGSVSLRHITVDTAEFGGFMIGNPDARGQGLATSVVRCVLRIAFEKMRLNNVYLFCNLDNMPAFKSYCNVGFEKTSRGRGTGATKEVLMQAEAAEWSVRA